MKKALTLSLALLLVLALFTGCQKADPAPSDTAPSTNPQTPPTPPLPKNLIMLLCIFR